MANAEARRAAIEWAAKLVCAGGVFRRATPNDKVKPLSDAPSTSRLTGDDDGTA